MYPIEYPTSRHCPVCMKMVSEGGAFSVDAELILEDGTPGRLTALFHVECVEGWAEEDFKRAALDTADRAYAFSTFVNRHPLRADRARVSNLN